MFDERSTRRTLLKGALGAAAAGALAGCTSTRRAKPSLSSPARGPARVVLLRFGGGVRYADVFGPSEECLAPTLRALAAEGTLYTDLWNDHLTHHDCATLYMLTGRYGARQDGNEKAAANLADLRKSPLVHEAYRRATSVPPYKALSVGMPSVSEHPLHGAPVRAATFCAQSGGKDKAPPAPFAGDPSLVAPPELAAGNEKLGRLALDLSAPDTPVQTGPRRKFLEDKVDALLAKSNLPCAALLPAWKQALVDRFMEGGPYLREVDADSWMTDLTLEAMRTTRPDLVTVGFVTPDLAHLGAWRDYAAAVRNVDLQVRRVVDFVAHDEYYAGRTLVLIAPDVGRGTIDFTDHDRPFDDPAHRKLFLVALGRGAKPGVVIDERREQTTIAPTIAATLGFTLGQAEAAALTELA